MTDSEATLRARLSWVKHYEASKNAGLTCLRCGISRPTLRKWWRRYQQSGEAGLHSQSRRRKTTPAPKVTAEHEQRITELRTKRKLGPKGIQNELRRLHQVSLSTATIWRGLHRRGVSASVRPRRRVKGTKRYSRPVPGDRVQMDTCKIRKGLYQFTAVDDCTRLRVLALFPNRKAESAAEFVQQHVLKRFPFPVQRIQTDRGPEFIGDTFQRTLRAEKIKFRPVRPRSPHLNGKVERSQQTDRVEFWATVDVGEPIDTLGPALSEWQTYYNTERGHSSLAGKTPQQRYDELLALIPSREAVQRQYDPTKEVWQTNSRHAWVLAEDGGFSWKRCR